jgi:hypothetical protein
MSSLTVFNTEDGLELVVDTVTGEAFATQAGYARMSGLSQQGVNKRTHNLTNKKTAEIYTTQGLRTHNLIPAKVVFEWLMKDKPELALAMGEVGATVYIHKLAGFTFTQPQQTEPPKQITSYEKATTVNSLAASLQMFGIEIDNPRFKQAAKDLVCDILGLNQNPQLTLQPKQDIYLGVAERAEQLGYSVSLTSKYRSSLGKYVKASGLEPIQEKRLCNGTERLINLYLLNEQLDATIKEFMDAKVLAS